MNYLAPFIASLTIVLPVLADTPLINFSSNDIVPEYVQNNTASNNGFGLGFTFTVVDPITVTSLGIFNGVSGLQSSHTVALYQVNSPSTGTLLSSATIGPGDTAIGSFVYKAIDSIVLNPGTYELMTSYMTSNPDAYTHDPLNLAIDPRIIFGQNRTLSGNNDGSGNVSAGLPVYLTDANVEIHPSLDKGWFGPNLLSVEVPEPATFITVLSLSALALGRKYSKAAKKPN